MVRVELGRVVMRRMEEDDVEVVKALIKEGCEGTENRLILHILTRPLCLFMLAVLSSLLRCLVHSFILALAIPVFLLTVYLKITTPRSTGVLGSHRPYWDYVGSSHRGTRKDTLPNPHARSSSQSLPTNRSKNKAASKDKDRERSAEKVSPEREQAAGQVWVAECEGEILGCIFKESDQRAGTRRICRLVTGSWYRREGLGRLLVQGLEHRERETGARRIYAHVPYPSKVGEVFFRKLGYQLLGERTGEGEGEEEEEEEEEERELELESPERGFLGHAVTKVFFKDLSDRKVK
ncbi:putative N-acetyltransferase 14 [Cynoglossus semilaevis]|uniref:putative N-acetyltransferase 14 n=1 Tax=Cynoglossus semilaevis TaxID=244447 RepID=UPI00049609D7|nr:N-acetyltransferase 14 [Cynoglossus semilaevis]XP_024917092.1 N-acetyltransferase 14 [Cynoglossus semilaevis]